MSANPFYAKMRATRHEAEIASLQQQLSDCKSSLRATEAERDRLRTEQITNALAWRELANGYRTALERIVTAHDSYIDTNRYAVENPDWLDDEINAARSALASKEGGK